MMEPAHTVDRDPVGRHFPSERRDEADLGGLGCVVSGRATGLSAKHRRDDDDAAPTSPSHRRQGHQAEPEGRVKIAGHRLLHFPYPGIRPAAAGAEAEVVDEDTDRAGSVQRRLTARFCGDVSSRGYASDLRRHALHIGIGAGGHRHPSALCGQRPSDGETDAAGGAGDQGCHALKPEVHHAILVVAGP